MKRANFSGRKEVRRSQAQARQELYDKLPLEDKIARAGAKEKKKKGW